MCAKEQTNRLIKHYFQNDVRWHEFDIVFNYFVRRDMREARLHGDMNYVLNEFSIKYKIQLNEVLYCSERNNHEASIQVVKVMGVNFQPSKGITVD